MTLDQKLVEIVTQLQQQLTNVAPLAWQAALAVVRINAVWDFIAGIGLLIVGLLVVRWLKGWWKLELVWEAADGRAMATVFISIALGLSIVAEFFLLLNPWTYVGIFNPALRLAHDLLKTLVKP